MSLLLDGDNGESLPGSLTFTSLAARITGDFSNATQSNRVSFQTNTVNGNTTVQTLANGTGTISGFVAYNASSPTNSSYLQMLANGSTEVRIFSGVLGTGTYLPLTFYNYNLERMRIEADSAARIKTTASVYNTRIAVTIAASLATVDLSLGNNFSLSVTGPATLSFTNQKDCQTGTLLITNSSGYALSKDGSIGSDSNFLATISAAGTYLVGYSSGGSVVRISYTQNTA